MGAGHAERGGDHRSMVSAAGPDTKVYPPIVSAGEMNGAGQTTP